MRKIALMITVMLLVFASTSLTTAQDLDDLNNDNTFSIDCMLVEDREIAFCMFSLEDLEQEEEEEEESNNADEELIQQIRDFIEQNISENSENSNSEANTESENSENNENSVENDEENNNNAEDTPSWVE